MVSSCVVPRDARGLMTEILEACLLSFPTLLNIGAIIAAIASTVYEVVT